jgi:predicted amidophosphoribosyltransferase
MKICSQNPEHALALHPPGAKFCLECGAPLEDQPETKCRECGQVLTKSQPYCHMCGRKITEAA